MVTSLRSFLSTGEFRERLANTERRMTDFYRYWQVHAPHYTDHGEAHSKTVEQNLDELIPDELKSEINEYEIFLLISSAYLHDVGIMCATSTDEKSEEIRANHHKRSEEFIIKNMKDLLNASERFVVGKIALAHRDSVPLDSIVPERMIRHSVLGNKQVRVRFLAALLRLADSCDLCHTRTNEDLMNVGKLAEEASFHHALHERVSGVSFDTKDKTIYIDLNIASDEEKDICLRYIVASLQKSLDTVKDHLIRNGLLYISVTPRFTLANTLLTELIVPEKVKEIGRIATPAVTRWVKTTEAERLMRQANALSNTGKFSESLECCEAALKIAPRSPFVWLLKARNYAELSDLGKACESYDKVAEYGSGDPFYNSDIGHFYGEIMLDYIKSHHFFEKAYQQSPRDTLKILNYAEALVTIGKPQEAYNLATRIWSQTNEIIRRVQSGTIRVISLFFLGDLSSGLDELKELFYFVRGCYPLLKEKNEWVYNKLHRYIADSPLNEEVKELLGKLMDLVEGKISVDDFDLALSGFAKGKH